MLKKAMVIGGALVLLLTLFNTPTIKSFVSTAFDRGKEVVADAESIENKIRRAESMIKDLTKPISRSMHQIAREEVEVDKLRTQLANSEERLAKADHDIRRLRGDLQRTAPDQARVVERLAFEGIDLLDDHHGFVIENARRVAQRVGDVSDRWK